MKLPDHNASRRTPSGVRAFSLIEMIGVVAVVALLASALLVTIVRRVDTASSTRETTDLGTIGDASVEYILRNTNIPAITLWASNIASEMILPVNSVTTNSRHFARLFLADPNFNVGGINISNQQYSQTINGASSVTNARILILSSPTRALPTVTDNTAEFNAIWNAPASAKPATTTWTNWPGTADDLLVKRLNLQPLFYQLILVDRDAGSNATFSVNTTNTSMVVNGTPWNAYYLSGSTIGLSSNSVLQTSAMLQRNVSYVFENGYWSTMINGPRITANDLGADFNNAAQLFYAAETNPNANNKGGDQNSVLSTFNNFMQIYTYWANDTPNFPTYGVNNPQNLPIWRMLEDAQNYMLGNAGTGKTPGQYTGLLYY